MMRVTVGIPHEKIFSRTAQNLGVTSVTLLSIMKHSFLRVTEGLAVTVLLPVTLQTQIDLFNADEGYDF